MQGWNVPRVVLRLMAVVGVLAGMLTVLGCPGGHEAAPVGVAATDVTVPSTATTVKALEGLTFTFPSGGAITPALANQPITVTFTNTTATTPTATVTAPNVTGTDGNPAHFTATTTFGSCTFVVTSSTFPVPPGPAAGNTITVDPCQINVKTGGVQATGQATTVQILVQLGLTSSAAQPAQVSIDPTTGVVTVNNVNTGQTVVLQVVTGTGGGTP